MKCLYGVAALLFASAAIAQISTDMTNPASAELALLRTNADLAVADVVVGLDAELAAKVRNRGDVAVTQPIQVDFYQGTHLLGSRTISSLNGKQVVEVKHPIYKGMACERRDMKVVVDAQNRIAELHNDNNSTTIQAVLPCPDLAVKSIRKNWNSIRTEYVGQVTLINQGHVSVPFFFYQATSTNNATFGGLPGLSMNRVDELKPGETHTFTLGTAFAYEKMKVYVLIDGGGGVRELDETNNMVEKVLD